MTDSLLLVELKAMADKMVAAIKAAINARVPARGIVPGDYTKPHVNEFGIIEYANQLTASDIPAIATTQVIGLTTALNNLAVGKQDVTVHLTDLLLLAGSGVVRLMPDGSWVLDNSVLTGTSGVTAGVYGGFTINSAGIVTDARAWSFSDLGGYLPWSRLSDVPSLQPLDSDLTALSLLSGAGFSYRHADGTWALNNDILTSTSDVDCARLINVYPSPVSEWVMSWTAVALESYQPWNINLSGISSLPAGDGYARRIGGAWSLTTAIYAADLEDIVTANPTLPKLALWNSKGLVTGGRAIAASDVPVLDAGTHLSGIVPVGMLPVGTTAGTVAAGDDPRFGGGSGAVLTWGTGSDADRILIDGVASGPHLTGPAGAAGAAGNTVLNGIGAPGSGAGVDGDFYIDTLANAIYGPKASGAWPSTGTLLTGSATAYDFAFSFPSAPASGVTLLAVPVVRAFTLPANLVGSYADAITSATASATLTIKKNGSSIGTINFAAGAAYGTFSFASAVSFAAGDVLTVVNQSPTDTTLAAAMTFSGILTSGSTSIDITGGNLSVMAGGAVLQAFAATRAITLPASLTGSYARAVVNAAGSTTLTIKKNESNIGSINFAAGTAAGTFTFASLVAFAPGDVLTVANPATADATGLFCWTLKGG